MKQTAFSLALLASLSIAACKDPAKDTSKAQVSAPADPSVAAQKPAGGVEHVFSATGSKVGFVGSKVTGSHEGSFGTFTGSISLADKDPEKSQVTVEIDTTSVTTDQEKLTGHLKSPDFFDTAKYPKAKFVSTAVKKGGDKGASHTVTGNLDLHGVTKQISFPATITVGDGKVDVDAEFAINRKDFGINYKGKADDLIRDDVVMKLSIRSTKK